MLDWAYTQSYYDVALLSFVLVVGFIWFIVKGDNKW